MSDYCESYLITVTFCDTDSGECLHRYSALPYIPNVGDTVKFKDGYYKLIYVDTVNPNANAYDKKLFKKRRYHNVDYIAGKIEDEFKANNIQAAIEKFNHRNELR